jgi:hypothetical protein
VKLQKIAIMKRMPCSKSPCSYTEAQKCAKLGGENFATVQFLLTFANSGHVLEPHGTTLECGEEGEKMGVRDGRRKL